MASKINNFTIIRKVLDQGLHDIGITLPSEHIESLIVVYDMLKKRVKTLEIKKVKNSLFIEFEEPISALLFDKDKFINTVIQTQYIVTIDHNKVFVKNSVINGLVKFKEHMFSMNNIQIPYRLFKSKESSNLHPLVVFLHGSGERGSDNLMQLVGNKGAMQFSDCDFQKQYGCFVLAPQAPLKDILNHCWIEDDMPKSIMALIEYIVFKYSIDKKRIYIVGMSNGGSGVYKMVYDYPNYFAGAFVMCGIVDTTSLIFSIGKCNKGKLDNVDVSRFISTPMYICHDKEDPLVDVRNSLDLYERIRTSKHIHLYLTKGKRHTCWIDALNNKDILDWLMNQRR